MSSAPPHPVFLLDANVFIEAAKRYYGFGIAPGYWDALIIHAGRGPVRSIDRIKLEIIHNNHELETWVNANFHGYFESTNQQDVISAYSRVMAWTQAQKQYSANAQAEFARGADGWLIAHALAKRYVVVTEELYEPTNKKKIKIPNVCRAAQIPSINTFNMLHQLGVKLTLPHP